MSSPNETWDIWADIASITAWLDKSNPASPHDDSMRVSKIGEEIGEAYEVLADLARAYETLARISIAQGKAAAAYIGMVGQNPRKGKTHTESDLMLELADVAVTALCAIQHFTQNSTVTRGYLASKIAGIIARSNIDGRQTEITIPDHIPAGYCRACANSGVGACDAFPDCPAGISPQ